MQTNQKPANTVARWFASFLDTFLFYILTAFIASIASPLLMVSGKIEQAGTYVIIVIGAVIYYLIFAVYPANKNGQTIGKGVIDIRVTNYDGSVPRARKLIVRRLLAEASMLIWPITLVAILADEKRRGFHDHICKTYVIHV